MNLTNKRIFISGGAGVIGQALVKILVNAGAKVFVGDLKPKPENFSKDIYYWQGDLNNISELELAKIDPHIYVNLAASFERTYETFDFWEENYTNNIQLSHNLLTKIFTCKSLEKIIYASSYLIYDSDLYQFDYPSDTVNKLHEKSPIKARNLIGASKLYHESELNFISNFISNNIKIHIVRIFRGYGIGSRDVISRWIRKLILGDEIEVYNPEGVFDFIFSEDSAFGIFKLIESDIESSLLNLGTGQPRTIQDVLNILNLYFPNFKSKSIQSSLKYESSSADISKLRSLLKWEPEHNLELGISKIIEYERIKLRESKISKHNFSVLITSSSDKIPLIKAIKRQVEEFDKEISITIGDASNSCLSFELFENKWLMKTIDSIKIQDIIQFCLLKNIRFIIPTRDNELLFWAMHKNDLLNNNIDVLVSNFESINLCLDKLQFYNFGKKNNFNMIPTFENLADLKEEQIVVKERFGSGSQQIGLNLSQNSAFKHAKTLSNPIFQPHIKGVEVSADSWVDRFGKPKGVVLRYRNLIKNGESKVTTTFQDEKLEYLVAEILEKLNLRGHVVLQFILDQNKKPWIIECNPRLGGASTASFEVGLRSIYWSIFEKINQSYDNIVFHRSNFDIKQIRIQSDLNLFNDYNS